MMGVSRSGYYKWKNRGKPKAEDKKQLVIKLVDEVHKAHPSHGYRWVRAYIRNNHGVTCSENYVYKAFRYLGIKSETKHKQRPHPRKIKDKYPNLIFSTWETVDRPRQVIVSDMTVIRNGWIYVEVTFYFDVFTKQILTWKMTNKRGLRNQYIEGLEDIVKLLRGSEEPTILHTDQGSVYASVAYNELIKDTNIIRSMSRAGTPTDNPVNESLNGWIKEELYIDFNMGKAIRFENVRERISKYVTYYNSERPSYAIGYDTPDNYYKRYIHGELERKDTFSKRVLSPEPKFVKKKRSKADKHGISEVVSTSEKERERKKT